MRVCKMNFSLKNIKDFPLHPSKYLKIELKTPSGKPSMKDLVYEMVCKKHFLFAYRIYLLRHNRNTSDDCSKKFSEKAEKLRLLTTEMTSIFRKLTRYINVLVEKVSRYNNDH